MTTAEDAPYRTARTANARVLSVILSLVSVASWGAAVPLMKEVQERLLGVGVGISMALALFGSVARKSPAPSGRIPLLLFTLASPVFAGAYLTGVLDAMMSSLAALGLSALWLISNRLHEALGLTSFTLAICALLLLPADLVLRRWHSDGQMELEPHPACPLVRRLPRLKNTPGWIEGGLAWKLGNQSFVEKIYVVDETDRKGFSVVAGSSESRPFDLVLLGDSYTQRDLPASWCDLVCRNAGLNVRNLGVGGTGPWEEYMNFRLEFPELKLAPGARVLWCLFSGNDLDDFYGPLPFERVPMTTFWPRLRIASENFRRHSWVRNVIGDLLAGEGSSDLPQSDVLPMDRPDGPRMLFLKHYLDQARMTQGEIERSPSFPALAATIQCMAEFVRSESLDLRVLVFPCKEEVYRWLAEPGPAGAAWATPASSTGFGLAVRGLCQRNGLHCYDLTPAFIENSKREFLENGGALWRRDDTHWNAKGHELTGRIVTEILRNPK